MMKKNEWILKICIIGSNDDLTLKFGRLTADSGFSSNYMATTGVDIPTKRITINGQRAKLIIMNISGHMSFLKIRKSYFTGAIGCIILFDKGNRESFEQIADFYAEFRQHKPEPWIPILIIGIKTDKEEVSTEESKRLAETLTNLYSEKLKGEDNKLLLFFKKLYRRIKSIFFTLISTLSRTETITPEEQLTEISKSPYYETTIQNKDKVAQILYECAKRYVSTMTSKNGHSRK